MTLQLFAHPFSSYCQKVLIALYENAIPFEFRMLGPDQPENQAELHRLWPIGKFPVLRDGFNICPGECCFALNGDFMFI